MPFDELDAESFRFVARQGRSLDGDAAGRIVEGQDPADFGQYLFENFQPFCREVAHEVMNPGQSAAGFGEAVHQLAGDRVAADRKYDGDVSRGGFRLGDDRGRQRVDES